MQTEVKKAYRVDSNDFNLDDMRTYREDRKNTGSIGFTVDHSSYVELKVKLGHA